jgi:hypothetical protein
MAKTIDQLTALGATPDDSDNLVIDDSGVTKKVTAAQLKGDCVRSAKNNALSTTVGTRIGTANNQLLGFWNVTPVVQPAGANQAALTDSTGGTAGSSLVAAGGSYTAANINNNFATLNRLVAEMRTALVNTGIIKGAA